VAATSPFKNGISTSWKGKLSASIIEEFPPIPSNKLYFLCFLVVFVSWTDFFVRYFLLPSPMIAAWPSSELSLEEPHQAAWEVSL
jgi:hypothetical protein